MNLLLETFFEQYGLIIILLVAFALIMVYYFLKNRKFQQSENEFQTALKVGDKVKTYSGFYGTIEKITETTDGKVVTLRLGEKATVDVDIRALMGLDAKEELKETTVRKPDEEEVKKVKIDNLKEGTKEEVKEEPKQEEVKEEKVEEKAEEAKEEPEKPKAKRKTSKK